MLHSYLRFGPEIMCEKVGIILIFIYFCMHLPCFKWLAFVDFGIFNFVAFLSMHVCAVTLYRFVMLHNTFH
jgi:hypothetical protein